MMSDKNILITGSNGGIGFSIAELLAKQNAKLTLLYHENNQKIEKLKQIANARLNWLMLETLILYHF